MNRRSSRSEPLHVQGIDAELTKKDIKNLRLRVTPDGRVAVSAPWHVPHEAIEAFVAGHRQWILTTQAKVRLTAPVKEPIVDGGRARLWGTWHELRVADGPRASATVHDGVISIVAPDEAGRARALDNLYRRELTHRLEPLHQQWAARIGRSASTFKLRRMTSRWGTCKTSTAVITLNLALAERPIAALEYVLVHELTHLHERGHGPRFHHLMDTYLPDWRARRASLRGHP